MGLSLGGQFPLHNIGTGAKHDFLSDCGIAGRYGAASGGAGGAAGVLSGG